ncbi:hypothetical protein N7540_010517 [Penicillium herquei]|nr:hypothetical protein N7540_010517 [Penicillium herquei]
MSDQVAASSNYQTSVSLLSNGGFETASLDTWRLIANPDSGIINDPVEASEGAYYLSAKTKSGNGENFIILYTDEYSSPKSGHYAGHFDYKISLSGATGCTLSAQFNSSGKPNWENSITSDVNEWTEVCSDFSLNDSDLFPQIMLSCSTGEPTLQIDNISILPTSSAQDGCTNPIIIPTDEKTTSHRFRTALRR